VIARALGAVLLAAAAAGAAPLQAQRYWKETLYPLPFYSAVDGLWIWGHYGRWSPVGFEERPEPHLAALNIDAGASTAGSRLVTVDFQAPAWWNGWRLAATAGAARANRLGYYGLGNATPYAADSMNAARPYLYRVSRSTQWLRLNVQRQLLPHVRALIGATIARTTYRALPGESQYQRDVQAGVVDTLDPADRAARVGLVFDTRDHEIDPHQGVFAEVLVSAGDGYERATGAARVYLRPLERLTVALRLVGEDIRGDAPLSAMTTIESSERPLETLGGYTSLRGYYDGRFAGPGKLLGGLEARYALLWAPTLLEVKLVGFYEAGRVFAPGEPWRLTTDALHHSGGVELAARLQRNALVVTGVGFSDEGARFLFGMGWSF
jgi:outer membrane protein assembly factor BamA